jgi:drug/metabolite transporter (DMT)-like permease
MSAAVVFLVVSPFTDPITWPTSEVWFALLVTALLATAAGFYVQTYVQQRLCAVEAAVIIVTEPLFAAFFGYLLVGDRLTWLQMLGGLLMVGALFLGQVYPLLRREREPARS